MTEVPQSTPHDQQRRRIVLLTRLKLSRFGGIQERVPTRQLYLSPMPFVDPTLGIPPKLQIQRLERPILVDFHLEHRALI